MRMTIDIGAAFKVTVTETVAALRRHRRIAGPLVVAGALLAGCGTSTNDRAISGAGIGAGAGALGGALFGIPAIGAAIGAATGVGVGVATKTAEPSAGATVGVGMPIAPTDAIAEAPSGSDHVVTTYVSETLGPNAARAANRRAAVQTCGDGFVLIDELAGADVHGTWYRLVYGCLAKKQGEMDRPRVQTSGR
jgi:osmotically inducible lipoprotein OsmB